MKNEPNVMFVLFEDMKSDLASVLRRLGVFLGGKYEEMLQNQNTIDTIMDGVNISKMHATAVKGVDGAFFRKGVIGDWRKHLTPEMVQRLNAKFKEYDDAFNIAELWKNYEDLLPKLS